MQINPLDEVRSSWVLGIFVLVFFVIAAQIYQWLALTGQNASPGELFSRDTLIWVCTYPLIALLLWAITRQQRDELTEMVLRIPDPHEVRDYLWLGVPMVLSASAFMYLLFYPLSLVAPGFVQAWLLDTPPLFYWDEQGSYFLTNLAALVMALVFAPLVEEFLFRGYLLNRWTLKLGALPAVLLSSFLFAILHPDVLGAFVFGVFQCLLYMKTRSLLGPILLHFSNNLLAVALEWMDRSWWSGFEPTTLQDFYDTWWMGLLGLVIGVPWLWRYARQHFLPVVPLLAAHQRGGSEDETGLLG